MIDTTMLTALADEDFCYLTTTGRKTGKPHTIEIWFALHDRTLYLLAGGRERSDWVRNIIHSPTVGMRVGTHETPATGRIVSDPDEDALVRRLVLAKYAPNSSDDLTEWGKTSLAVAIDV